MEPARRAIMLIVSVLRRVLGKMRTLRPAPCPVRPATIQRAPSPSRNLVFRPAQPSDVNAAVPLIYSSAPAAFDYLFAVPGRCGAQEFLRRAFVDGAGQFGFRSHVVGVEDGVVVAVGAAWCGLSRLAFMLDGGRQTFACYGVGAALGVIWRACRVEKIIAPPARSELCIGNLGVSPQRRGGGIGAALIAQLIAQHRHSGIGKAVLNVAVSNPRGQQLYERLGFTVTAERRSRLANAAQAAVVNHRRMEISM
jgi:ribosomal protein S18 acetylase RimI-like enzyme